MKQVVQLSKLFDADSSGSIDYEEFVEFCEAPTVDEALKITQEVQLKKVTKASKFDEEELLEIIQSIHKEIHRRAAMGKGKLDFRSIFESMDQDGGGQVDMAEFVVGLNSIG